MVIPVLIVRNNVAMSQARRAASANGDRVLRESSTIRVATEVWSDVASTRGLGFRSEDGPLLHGELRSGGVFEMAVSEGADGQFATLAGVRLARPLKSRVVVRPHAAWTRALAWILRPPAELPSELHAAFWVRADSEGVATVLTPKLQALLALVSDRSPRLEARGEEVLLVLEGVELAHERIEAVLDAFETMSAIPSGPYRR